MKNLAPEIFRQRLLIEAYYTIEVTRESLAGYLIGACKGFDETAAVEFTRRHFSIAGEIATASI